MSQTEHILSTRVTRAVRGRYLLAHPVDYDDSRAWPLLLYLHGAGERGTDLARVASHGPPRLIREGLFAQPFIVVSPQATDERIWSVPFLDALLDVVVAAHAVDAERIYVTGLSMGGFGTWQLAFEFPHRFAAIAPVCGGGSVTGAATLRHLPVWAFHGARDSVVPVARTDELVAELRRCGGHVRYTRYEDADHDSWTRTYADPRLYAWLLTHRRGLPGPADGA